MARYTISFSIISIIIAAIGMYLIPDWNIIIGVILMIYANNLGMIKR